MTLKRPFTIEPIMLLLLIEEAILLFNYFFVVSNINTHIYK
jgi:hypothetical protein